MGGDEDDVLARRERRRRDRTKSPHNRSNHEDEDADSMGDLSARRKSAANFSASKLVESLKEANDSTYTRLRRVASTDGMAKAAGEARSSRRPVSRTMSAQATRRTDRRLRAADTDVLSHSLGDNLAQSEPHNNDMDNSNMSASANNRRRAPQRTKSSDAAGMVHGPTRTPRARRRPNQGDTAVDDELSNEQSRRRLPPRSKSAQDAFPPRGVARPARPGRRRPGNHASDDHHEEDVIISDSDEDEHNNNRDNNNIDRSSRRRGVARSRSAHDGPTPRSQRTARPPRRRPSGDDDDASPKRSTGPGFQRSLTGTPTASARSGGPGLQRSHTSTNPRGGRTRGGRNTAQELAQVASNRDKSPPDAEDVFNDDIFNDVGDPFAAREAVRNISSQHQSSSPIKSRQERRRLREEKEREALGRRTHGGAHQQEEEEVSEEPEEKEQPWMRRLKKNVGDRATSGDDSFNLGDGTTHTEGSKGSNSIPRIGDHGFAVDPTFGVFPAVSDMPLSTMDQDALNDDDGTAHLSIKGGNKLDFSTIS